MQSTPVLTHQILFSPIKISFPCFQQTQLCALVEAEVETKISDYNHVRNVRTHQREAARQFQLTLSDQTSHTCGICACRCLDFILNKSILPASHHWRV